MPPRIPRLVWIVAPLAFLLYFWHLGATGMVGPDEPRYASIGREMALSGDWVTPRLWGQPWFEKPALIYWMTGAAFRLGFSPDLAPRVLGALLAVLFLAFFWWIARREFGERVAWFAALILGTSGLWFGYSQVGVTDLPLTAAFSAFMLLLLPWFSRGEERFLPAASALLGVAVLAKGLVPLGLAAPAALALWWAWRNGRADWRGLLKPRVWAPFLVVALPWYWLCYARNGWAFIAEFFVKHHFSRFATEALQHQQPRWYYLPILAAALLPWAPLLGLAGRAACKKDARRGFLAAWVLFGLVMFSASVNKLPGYILPLVPALALLAAIGLDEAATAKWWLAVCALLLAAFPVAVHMLPAAMASGALSRTPRPAFEWTWAAPVAIAAVVWWLDRRGRRLAAVALLAAGAAGGIALVKWKAAPALDRAATARPLWREIAPRASGVCVQDIKRTWRYGLNYYSVTPLPECAAANKPVWVRQAEDKAPELGPTPSTPVDPASTGVVPSLFRTDSK
jgi:4-amino-4-deoxy-L-arabinose transferase-like glycosyltransferase